LSLQDLSNFELTSQVKYVALVIHYLIDQIQNHSDLQSIVPLVCMSASDWKLWSFQWCIGLHCETALHVITIATEPGVSFFLTVTYDQVTKNGM